MVEGPIQTQVIAQKKITKEAPFYILGMLPTDVAAGWDHIAGAIGGAVAGWAGADMLCYITPAEHLGLPTVEHVREGVIAFKIAAHVADIAKGIEGAWEWDLAMSRARYSLDLRTKGIQDGCLSYEPRGKVRAGCKEGKGRSEGDIRKTIFCEIIFPCLKIRPLC